MDEGVYGSREGEARDTVRDATREEIERLKRENRDLKELVAELYLEVHRLKKTAIPPFVGDDGTGV